MVTFKKILVPTDFSEFSQYALKYAAAFAKSFGGAIECVHVVDTTFFSLASGLSAPAANVEGSVHAVKTHAKKELDHFVQKEHLLGIDVKAHLREGVAGEEIVKIADDIRADLIIVPTHGRSGLDRLVFGSTCDKILRTAKCPVLIVKHPEHEALASDGNLDLKRILCPIDFSAFSKSVIPVAAEFAKQFGATIVLAHIADARFDYPEWTAQIAVNNTQHLVVAAKEDLGKVAQELKGIKMEIHVNVGVPHHSLVDLTRNDNIDLVIMPTHGRKGIAHAILGSVTERVARDAHCPVLVMRPKA